MSESKAPSKVALWKDRWPVFTAVGTFAVYLVGYLTLRFQLTALGLASDMQLFDERYLFAGGRFLVYLCSTIPLALVLLAPALSIGWGLLRLNSAKLTITEVLATKGAWLSAVGAVVSLVMIQFVLRKCFLFENLLLRDDLPGPGWFAGMLTASSDQAQWYFALLLVEMAAVGALTYASGWWRSTSPWQWGLGAISCVLLGIQALFLPVNYGHLMAARPLPRLADENRPWLSADPSDRVWLVWEGDRGVTLLLADKDGRRRLATVSRDQATQIEIVAYDPFTALRQSSTAASAQHQPTQQLVAQQTVNTQQAAQPPSSEWTWSRLADLAGITATPRMQRPESFDPVHGDIFVISSQPRGGETAFQLTTAGNYHSPLFRRDAPARLLALRNGKLMEIDTDAVSPPKEISPLPDAVRLLAIHPSQPEVVVFLAGDPRRPHVKSFDSNSRGVKNLASSASAAAAEALAAYALGEQREYGSLRLKVEQQGDGVRAWTDVFIQRSARQPYENLTAGNGKSSRQPALSPDGGLVAFVRVEP